MAPGFPTVPDITPKGHVGKYSEAEFTTILRTGITPDGRQIDPKNMPWTLTKEFSDLEIKALYKYLQSLPDKASEI
ncbi:hypothetical protein BH23BAC1_BH23BAC1_29830 [soil metagenome]